MKRGTEGAVLTAVFVDYDNIYMSLKRKNEEAAKRFSKDALTWIKEIESGRLITPSNGAPLEGRRRIVVNRCYGNPVPRRNSPDNSTDMTSFPFVRHHFLKAGFEVIDCPPVTAQLKNSSDIRIVMDVRDSISHDTRFDEFVILSSDADFTPLLHRLRAHARHTVIYANDNVVAPFAALSDGEVREGDLMALLLDGRVPGEKPAAAEPASISTRPPSSVQLDDIREQILIEVVQNVAQSPNPVPLEALADRAQRAIGYDKTVGTNWAGVGSFRELLRSGLPKGLELTDQPPYAVVDVRRHLRAPEPAPRQIAQDPPAPRRREETAPLEPAPVRAEAPQRAPQRPRAQMPAPRQEVPARAEAPVAKPEVAAAPSPAAPVARPQVAPAARSAPAADEGKIIQQAIAKIHDACQAPPLAPAEYRLVFDVMAQEITENGLIGAQTITNIQQRASQRGLEIGRDDVRFVLEVVSEADPWFEQGASPALFAGRFRNFVVARCRGRGLSLSAGELDLIDAWFAGNLAARTAAATSPAQGKPAASAEADVGGADGEDELPRFVRTRVRG